MTDKTRRTIKGQKQAGGRNKRNKNKSGNIQSDKKWEGKKQEGQLRGKKGQSVKKKTNRCN